MGTREALKLASEAERANASLSDDSLTFMVTRCVELGYRTTAEIKAYMAGKGFEPQQVRRALSGARRNGWLFCERYGAVNSSWRRTESPLTKAGRPKDSSAVSEQTNWRQAACLADDHFARLIGNARFEDAKIRLVRRAW